MESLRSLLKTWGPKQVGLLVLALGLNAANCFLFSIPEAETAPAVFANASLQNLTCEQALRIANWGKTRYRDAEHVKLDANEFAESTLQAFVEKVDPHRMLFTEIDAKDFIKHGSKAWDSFLKNKQCDFFTTWLQRHYSRAKDNFHSRLARLNVEALYPKTLKKSGSLADVRLPKTKDLAKDEKELKNRLSKWVEKIASATTPALLSAYKNDKKTLIFDTLNQMLFETPPQAETVLAKAVLGAMDPYSTYFSPNEFEDFYYDLAGGTSGIGIRVRRVPEGLFIEKLVTGSTADKSRKVKEGDIITHVDGVTLKSLNANASKQLLKGPEFSKVKLTMVRATSVKPIKLTLVRKAFSFEESRITERFIETKKKGVGPIAVIDIPSFYGRGGINNPDEERSSSEDLREVLTKILAAKKAPSAIVLDLRGNPGGFLEEAVSMAGYFIGNDPVVEVIEGGVKRILRHDEKKPLYKGPLFILTDEGTASASEVLAGALKDYQRAIIVGGKRTYGKGSVQKLFHLDDELLSGALGLRMGKGVVKLTTSVFYSPLGHTPANGGIAPHIPIQTKRELEDVAIVPNNVQDQSPFVDENSMREIRTKQTQMKSKLAALESLSSKRAIDIRKELKAVDDKPADERELEEAVSIAVDYVSMDQTIARTQPATSPEVRSGKVR